MSSDEYVYTVQDVLGVRLTEAQRSVIPVDRPLAGFVRTASGQTTLPDHVLAYAELAETIVADPSFDPFLNAHASCRELERQCAEAFIRSAGPLLFRRPVTNSEVATYADLFTEIAAENGFDRSLRAVAQALLQSPSFLYLLEPESTEDQSMTGYAMATRLSFALWSSSPDAELYAAAGRGDLDTVDGVVAQATRMLSDVDKMRRGRSRFLADWARLESLPDDDGLRSELIETAQAFYTNYVEADGDLFSIFAAPSAVLTPALAEGWELPSQGSGLRAYDTTGRPGRRGLLAQPGVVAGMTNADGGSIVARGLFLQAQLFCGEPPDPPPSLQATIEAFVAEQPADASTRAIADIRLERNACGSCHRQFDPLAFGFEHFDFRGRYRTEDEFGNAIRIDGWVPGVLTGGADQPYDNFEQYMATISETVLVRRCLVRRQLEFLLGRRLGGDQEAAVRAITEATASNGGRLEALVLAAVAHPVFRTTGPRGE